MLSTLNEFQARLFLANQALDQGRGGISRISALTGMSRTMSALLWTNKSTEAIAAELTRRGHPISDRTVSADVGRDGYSLQLNRKQKEGPQHPDRDAQFRHINRQEASFRASGDPVISVDTKKKELVGAFKNGGRTWRRKGKPYEVQVHDWPSRGKGKAIPYGVYDVQGDRAVVHVAGSRSRAGKRGRSWL